MPQKQSNIISYILIFSDSPCTDLSDTDLSDTDLSDTDLPDIVHVYHND